MNAAMFIFSGTGNTMQTASMLCDAFQGIGESAQIFNIETMSKNATVPELDVFDAVGIGYPVYAFNSPKMVLDFVKKLPEGQGRPAFILKTAGEPFYWNDSSSILIIKQLRKKGYRVVFERHFLMPYNIIRRYPDALVKQMVHTNKILCIDMAKKILKGEVYLPKFTIQSRLAAFFLRIQWPGAALNGRFLATNKRCNICGKCAKNCPVGNITLKNKKLRFGWKCIMCMRCALFCPNDAIKFGLIDILAFNGPYEFERILSDDGTPEIFINEKTKGFFGMFKKYYRWAGEICKKIQTEDEKPSIP